MSVKRFFTKAALATAVALSAAPAVAQNMPQPAGYQDTGAHQKQANAMQAVVDNYGDIFGAINQLPKSKLDNAAAVDYLIRDINFGSDQGAIRGPGMHSIEITSKHSDRDPQGRFALNLKEKPGGCDISIQTFGDSAKTIKGDKAVGEFMNTWFSTYVPPKQMESFKKTADAKQNYQQVVSSSTGQKTTVSGAMGHGCKF